QGTPSRRESEESLRAVIPNGVRNLSERFLARHGGLEMVTESLREAIPRLPAARARLQALYLRQLTPSPPCTAGLSPGTGPPCVRARLQACRKSSHFHISSAASAAEAR